MEFLPAAFQALVAYPQFIVYTLVPRGPKTDKLPIDHRSGQVANAHDPAIWLTADAAIMLAQAKGYGVGFVFTDSDPFWFLDIDDCIVNGAWSTLATTLLTSLQGAAVEVSTSGRGLHIIGTGQPPAHGCRNSDQKLEFYTSGRFVALTGTHAIGDAAFNPGAALTWLVDQYFSNSAPAMSSITWSSQPVPEWNGPTDDTDLISRALRSTSASGAFGVKATFRDLWECNVDALSKTYPDPLRAYDESAADAALAQHLAFWTGNNHERIQTIMRQSALVRPKWDREDYLPRTVSGACGRQKEYCFDKKKECNPDSSTIQDHLITQRRSGFLMPDDQLTLFKDCVYVSDEHKVLASNGRLLKPEQFQVTFGGHTMSLGGDNVKVTRNAWEAFTQSQVNPCQMADSTCFRPDLKPSTIIRVQGESLVNTWYPAEIKRTHGDVTPFLAHVAKLCPDFRDQWILLSYMAALVQYQGVKFQWCPVLQGVQGNGKTLLSRCITQAVGRRYSHQPKAAELANKFNDWLYRKVFIAVEDIYVPHDRLEIMEAIKPMITSNAQEIEPKGGMKVTRDICANFIINTNHKEGLRKTLDDRRFAPFYTAQQTVGDLIRDGMDNEYFRKLYQWLNVTEYAIVTDYLYTFVIPDEFNPTGGCQRAPDTSSTQSAVLQGVSTVEQEIQEAIDQDLPGFKGGWVSSMALDRLLDKQQLARRCPRNKRRETMQALGYDFHPCLLNGRVGSNIMPDNGKPRLYIHNSSPHLRLERPVQVERQYTQDQS